MSKRLVTRKLGRTGYAAVWQAMRSFTEQRGPDTADELWLLEHDPVFTQGKAGKAEHLIHPGAIPVVHTDRGGQVTYHGPGQLVGYCLIDLKRKELDIRTLVVKIESLLIDCLAHYGIEAYGKREAPGVYVAEAKIAALGLHVHKGCTYHGFSLNVDMDLSPFAQINPCGYANMSVTQLKDRGVQCALEDVAEVLSQGFIKQFGYTESDALITASQ